VIPLAVSPRFLDESFSQTPILEPHSAPVTFIYIGSLGRVRKLERVISAARLIADKVDNKNGFKITLLGNDKSKGYYQDYINELGLNDAVQIRPPVPYDDVPTMLLENDVALAYIPETPLDWQYHPTLKVLEYRAIGIPIIATDFEPNQEVVIDGENGLLVQNSAQDLGQAMARFIEDPDFLYNSKLKAGKMRQGLLWKEAAEMYERLYRQLTKQDTQNGHHEA
jgi:glycosyltransferase involved in cell wall biosynthesis